MFHEGQEMLTAVETAMISIKGDVLRKELRMKAVRAFFSLLDPNAVNKTFKCLNVRVKVICDC